MDQFKTLEEKLNTVLAENEKLRTKNDEIVSRFLAQGGSYNRNEKNILSSFGFKSVAQALNSNLASGRAKALPLEYRAQLLSLKNDLIMARAYACMEQGISDVEKWESNSGIAIKNILDSGFARSIGLEERLKAFSTGTAGEGLEWVPTIIGSSYIEEYELEKAIHMEFQSITMPAQSYRHPIHKNRTTAKAIAEGAEATGNSFGTGVIAFDAKKLYEYYPITDELTEESAPNIMSLAQSEVVKAHLRAYDAMIISGDDSVTHMDSDVVAANDARKLIKGLRKRAIDNSAAGVFIDAGGPITETVLKNMKAAMGKFASRPSELAWIPSPVVKTQMEFLPSVSTVDKIGNDRATVRHGDLSQYHGAPIMPSEDMRDDLNATGVYDGVTTDKGSLILVNRTRFFMGKRAPIRVRAARDPRPELDRFQLVSYSRVDWNGFDQDATERSVAYAYNISLT